MRRLLLLVALSSAVSCGGRSAPAAATATTAVVPGSLTLSGNVVETAPTSSIAIAGASVTLVEGPNIGSTTTDATGRFQLSGLRPGGITVRIRSANHVDELRFIEITADKAIEVQLNPVYEMVTTTSVEAISGGGDACPGYWDYFSDSLSCAADYVFNVHYNGSLRAEAIPDDPDTEFAMELYNSVDGRLSRTGTPLVSARPVDVQGHTQYVIRVRKFSNGGGPPPAGLASFKLTVTRPS
jgi:hypothetical protein